MKHILNDLSIDEKQSIREQHTGGIKVVSENFSKLINTKLGDVKPLVEQQTTTGTTETQKSIVNKVASEGLKNVTTEMISSPPFKGVYGGYQFGGVFKGIDYKWNCQGVEGFGGVRGMLDGQIISETIENMISSLKLQLTDIQPNSPSVGFYGEYAKFIIYLSKDGKVKYLPLK